MATNYIPHSYTVEEATEIMAERLESICPYLAQNKKCTGCAVLQDCRDCWDGIAGTHEDKLITEYQMLAILERFRQFEQIQMQLTLTCGN